MHLDDLLRALAAFMTFSFGIALLLVSIIVVIAALPHEPIFSLAGIGGIIGAAFIMQMSSAIVAPRRIALTVGDESD